MACGEEEKKKRGDERERSKWKRRPHSVLVARVVLHPERVCAHGEPGEGELGEHRGGEKGGGRKEEGEGENEMRERAKWGLIAGLSRCTGW